MNNSRRVLVVDAAASSLVRVIAWILAEEGHEVAVARGIREAQNIASEFEPDVVILDPDDLPSAAVRDDVARLRNVAPAARIIGLATQPDTAADLVAADEIQTTPFDAEDLLRRVAGD